MLIFVHNRSLLVAWTSLLQVYWSFWNRLLQPVPNKTCSMVLSFGQDDIKSAHSKDHFTCYCLILNNSDIMNKWDTFLFWCLLHFCSIIGCIIVKSRLFLFFYLEMFSLHRPLTDRLFSTSFCKCCQHSQNHVENNIVTQ